MTVVVMAAFVVVVSGKQQQQAPRPNVPSGVLLEPLGTTGEAIYPAFEGWGPLKDGSNVLLLGYFNRNKEAIDIPIGADNRIEPGGPDYGQPTHFHSGREWGVFAIPVPKDFGTRKLTWTLTANGHTSSVQFWLNPPYWIDFYKNTANGNEPPRIKFSPAGAELIGPPKEKFVQTLETTVGKPVELTAWVADQPPTIVFESTPPGGAGAGRETRKPTTATEPPPAIIGNRVITASGAGAPTGGGAITARSNNRGAYRVLWRKYRGPGEVKVADEVIPLENGETPRSSSKRKRPRPSARPAPTGSARRSTTAQATAAVGISAAGRRRTLW
jgi:hypothetical protein